MQEQILLFFRDIATPLLDRAGELITMLGEQYFFIIVISFLFWNISKREGFKLAVAIIYSTVLNSMLKIAFHTQRPFEKLDSIKGKRVETATGYSFPSGHTQGSTTFFITMAQIIRRRWFTVLAIILSLLVGLSRVYLGVHWPVDVLGGFALGILMSFIFCTIVDNYYDDANKMRKIFFPIQAVIIILTAGLFIADLVWLKGSMKIEGFFKMAGLSTGAVYGFFAEEKWVDFSAEDAGLIRKIIRFLIGLVCTVLILMGLKIIFPHHMIADFFRYAVTGLWVTFFWPAIGIAVRLFNRRSRVD